MMKSGGFYDRVVHLLSAIYIVVGLVLLVMTLSRGGTPISIGFLMGIAFLAIGIGRIWFQRTVGTDK